METTLSRRKLQEDKFKEEAEQHEAMIQKKYKMIRIQMINI